MTGRIRVRWTSWRCQASQPRQSLLMGRTMHLASRIERRRLKLKSEVEEVEARRQSVQPPTAAALKSVMMPGVPVVPVSLVPGVEMPVQSVRHHTWSTEKPTSDSRMYTPDTPTVVCLLLDSSADA